MKTLDIILYVLAAFCFFLAAIGVNHERVNFLALGLLAWVLVPLITLARS